MGARLTDAHCHVAFMADAQSFARDAHAAGAHVLAATVTPGEFEWFAARLAHVPEASALYLGLGFHPWWVKAASLERSLALFDTQLATTRFTAEVGLDFSKRHTETREAQIQAFGHIAHACAQAQNKVLSIHAVQAADVVLDILESSSCLTTCVAIFHWFSGSSGELLRARKAGCYFSVGLPMLKSKRGREYAKAIPLDRLLLETDAPPTSGAPCSTGPAAPEGQPAVPYTFSQAESELFETACRLASLRGIPEAALVEAVHQNEMRLLHRP